jgi:hypothetical protein
MQNLAVLHTHNSSTSHYSHFVLQGCDGTTVIRLGEHISTSNLIKNAGENSLAAF